MFFSFSMGIMIYATNMIPKRLPPNSTEEEIEKEYEEQRKAKAEE